MKQIRLSSLSWRRAWGVYGLAVLTGWIAFFQPRFSGDGTFYMLPLKNWLIDGYHHTELNQFPLGMAFFELPGYVLTHLGMLLFGERLAARFLSGPELSEYWADGWGFPYLYGFALLSCIYGAAAGALPLLYGRRAGLDPLRTLLVTLIMFFGTPLVYFVFLEPTMAHAVSAFANGLLFFMAAFWLNPRRYRDLAVFTVFGCATMLVRYNDLFFPALYGFYLLTRRDAGLRWRDMLPRAAWCALLAIGCMIPQFFVNYDWTGNPLNPRSYHLFVWEPWNIVRTLFSADHGVFFWHPVLLVAVGSVIALAASGRRASTFAGVEMPGFWWGILGIFGLNTLITGLFVIWWAGTFGDRRYLSLIFPLTLALLGWVAAPGMAGRRLALARTFLALALGAQVPFNLLLVRLYQTGDLDESLDSVAGFKRGLHDWWSNEQNAKLRRAVTLTPGRRLLCQFRREDLRAPLAGGWWSAPQPWAGFHYAWHTGEPAWYTFFMARPADLQVTFFTQPLPGISDQQMTLRLNGRRIDQRILDPGIQRLRRRLRRDEVDLGQNRLVWTMSRAVSPEVPSERRGLLGETGVRCPRHIELRVHSLYQGLLARIRVDGKNLSLERRGYNLVAMSPEGGILLRDAFAVFHDAFEQERMRHTLASLPPGTIVALALKNIGTPNIPSKPGPIAGMITFTLGKIPEHRWPDYRWLFYALTVATLPDGTTRERFGFTQRSREDMEEYRQWLLELPEESTVQIASLGKDEIWPWPDLSKEFALIGALYQTKEAAVIGVVGARPESALQSFGTAGVVYLDAGGKPEELRRAAAIAYLTIDAAQ